MANLTRLTTNTSETEIARLISGDTIFSIPYFQRPYRWSPQKLKDLVRDILKIVDEESDSHFMGAIIVHGKKSNPSDPNFYEVIDGQQRLTTLFLILCAAVKVMCQRGESDEALGLFLKYLVINRKTGSRSNYKIHSCKDDRSQMNRVFSDLIKEKGIESSFKKSQLVKLPDTGNNSGHVWSNYKTAVKFFQSEFDEGGVKRIQDIYSALLDNLTLVQIDVTDPLNGPKIFNSLNSSQEPMTIGDLVRNEIFSRVADKDTDEIERIDTDCWQPFYKGFEKNKKNLFDAYFFPYGLIQNPNLKKSEVFNYLKKSWEKHAPEEIITELTVYQNAFIDILVGENNSKFAASFNKGLRRLKSLGMPNSTLPFLMQLCDGLTNDKINEKESTEILSVVESFLVRRAAVGHEPTGLHAVFKRLWNDCKGDYNAKNIIKIISTHRTVSWPNDEEFQTQIIKRPIYVDGSTLPAFMIFEYDKSLGGDAPENTFQIEHILPNKITSEWKELFTEQEHESLKDTLANLIPISISMNPSLSNGPYSKKRTKYREDSVFKSARQLAEKVEKWTPETLRQRAIELASWAVKRWPHNKE